MLLPFGSCRDALERVCAPKRTWASRLDYRKYPGPAFLAVRDVLGSIAGYKRIRAGGAEYGELSKKIKYAAELKDGVFILRGVYVEDLFADLKGVYYTDEIKLEVCTSLWSKGFFGASNLTGGELLVIDSEMYASSK